MTLLVVSLPGQLATSSDPTRAKIHWYWPFARPEEISLAESAIGENATIRIDVIDRDGAPEARSEGPIAVVRSLPDVDRSSLSRLKWIASRGWTYWARARQRSIIWREGNFDIVHIHYLNRFTDLRLGRHRPGKVVLSVHDVVPHQRRGPATLEKWILRRIYSGADALVVHHRALKDALISDFGIDERRVRVIGHQVFPIPPELRSDIPEHETPTVLFFGSLRSNKGIPLMVQVIQQIPDHVKVRFQFAGHGDKELEALLLELAADSDRVDVEIGFASYERKTELFRQASIVVLPYTEFASQSGVLHDAYGHGRPVVVTNVGALGETVREDGTGTVVAPHSPSQFAQAIMGLLQQGDTWQDMAAATRRVSTERSPKHLGAELRSLYEDLLSL